MKLFSFALGLLIPLSLMPLEHRYRAAIDVQREQVNHCDKRDQLLPLMKEHNP